MKKKVYCGLSVAVISVLSLISMPLPSGIPITLQTFAIALTGFLLGKKYSTVSVLAYITLGAVGLPIFAGFRGGLSVILGYTGGFIFGFIPLAFCCGCGKKFSALGLIVCHLFGILQYSLVANVSFIAAFLTVSAPYLIKDALSLIAAYFVCKKLRS